MNPTTSISNTQVYGAHADYKAPPSEAQADAGVVPLDTLPAAWWNQLWYDITSRNNNMVETVLNIRDEILSVLSDANITPSALQTNQLLQAIEVIRRRFPTFDAISHDPIPGSVISSAARNSVSVDSATGQMTPNALSDWTSNKSVKTVISEVDQKVDDVSSTVTGAIETETAAREAKDVGSVANTTTSNTLATTITSSDGTQHTSVGQPIVRSVGVDATTDTNTVKVSVNGVENSDTVVKNVSATRSGDTVTIDVNGVQDTFSVASAAQDYKETEQNTGKKWVNGDKVYSKTVIGKNKQITHETVPFSKFAPDLSLSYLDDNIEPKWQAPYIIYDGKLYVGNGSYNSNNASGYVYCLDGTTWTQAYQTAYSVNCMIIYDGKLYVGCGYNSSSSGSGYVYCFDGTTWTQVSQITYSVNCMIIYDGKLYVGCGYDYSSGGSNGYVYCFDGTTWTQVSQTAYSVHCMIIYDGKLYVGCGYSYSYGGINGYVYCFDGTTWSQAYQTAYSVNCMIIYDGKLYVGCGYNSGGSGSGYVYCFDGTTWSQAYQTSGGWGIYHFTVYNGYLYAFPGGCASQGTSLVHFGPWFTQDGVTWEDINATLFDLTMQYSSTALIWGFIPYTKVITYPDTDFDHPLTETHEQLWLFTSWYKGGTGKGARAVYKTMTDYITYVPNNHISTIPDFKHLVKCDRVVDDKPSEIGVSIDPATGNVDVGDPVRDYEHLDGVQLLLEYTKNEV